MPSGRDGEVARNMFRRSGLEKVLSFAQASEMLLGLVGLIGAAKSENMSYDGPKRCLIRNLSKIAGPERPICYDVPCFSLC